MYHNIHYKYYTYYIITLTELHRLAQCTLETIIHCFNALSEDHGVYFCLVLVALLSALVVRVDLFYQNKLGHVPVNFGPRVWDKDDHILLTLEVDPYILRIGALAPSTTL